MVHNPNTFSQTSHAMRMMMTTYGKLESETDSTRDNQSSDVQDYKWNEIYPVIKASFSKQDLLCQSSPTATSLKPVRQIDSTQGGSLKQIEPATCERIANTMTRKLYQRFTNANNQGMKLQKSSSKCKKEEVKIQHKGQNLLGIKLPKLTCNWVLCKYTIWTGHAQQFQAIQFSHSLIIEGPRTRVVYNIIFKQKEWEIIWNAQKCIKNHILPQKKCLKIKIFLNV